MVFGHHNTVLAFGSGLAEGSRINRLYRIEVNNANREAFRFQNLVGLERLMQGNAGPYHTGHIVGGSTQHLTAADGKAFVWAVDHRRFLASCTHIVNACTCSHLSSKVCGRYGTRRVEHGAAADGPHHGEVL